MMARVRTILIAAITLGSVAACAPVQSIGNALSGGQTYPPDRSAWDTAPSAVRIAHARALHLALTGAASEPRSWSAGEARGTISLLDAKEKRGTICVGFLDRIQVSGTSQQVKDVACWGDGWFLVRRPDGVPILAPAFDDSEKVYVVKRRATLKTIARRTGTDLVALKALNPGHPRRLPKGTRVLLP